MIRSACVRRQHDPAPWLSFARLQESSLQAGGQRGRKEGKPEQLASNARFRPFRMLMTYPLPVQISSEQAHLISQKESLLARHRSLNIELYGLRRGICVGNRHGEMVTCAAPNLYVRRPGTQHFRIVLLPDEGPLAKAYASIGEFIRELTLREYGLSALGSSVDQRQGQRTGVSAPHEQITGSVRCRCSRRGAHLCRLHGLR